MHRLIEQYIEQVTREPIKRHDELYKLQRNMLIAALFECQSLNFAGNLDKMEKLMNEAICAMPSDALIEVHNSYNTTEEKETQDVE